MLTQVTLLAGLAGFVFLAPVETLSDALEVVAQGRKLEAVPPTVAADAIQQLSQESDPEVVAALAQVAGAGDSTARARLQDALLALLPARSEASRKAVQLLGDRGLQGTQTLSSSATSYLLELATDDEDVSVATHAATLAAPSVSARDVMNLIEASVAFGDSARTAGMLAAAGGAGEPAELIVLLAALQLDPAQERPAGTLVTRLVGRSREAAEAVLQQLSAGALGPRSCFVRGLAGVKFSDEALWERAAEVLRGLLAEIEADPSGLSPSVVAATVAASGDLLIPEVVSLARDLALVGPPEVRVAALEAIERVCYRDVPTTEFLIGLLEDPIPAVAAAAYHVLQAKSGERQLPQRVEVWRAWLASARLPEAPPKETVERLAERRQALAVQERVNERRQRRGR